MELFHILIVVAVNFKFVKNHWIVCFTFVSFIVGKLCLSVADF